MEHPPDVDDDGFGCYELRKTPLRSAVPTGF